MSDIDDPTGAGESGPTVPWARFADEAEQRLAAAGVEQARLEARWIVEEVSGIEPGEWVLRRDEPATLRGVAAFDRLVARREAGEPIQYVLGHWSFRALDLFVDRRVLIPRPETEVLVDLALAVLAEREDAPLVADLGTGSGAIALAIAAEHPTARVLATDVSPDAIAVARANTAGLGRPGARVELALGSWFDPLDDGRRGHIDLVVSNPPYIGGDELLPESVRAWEPRAALVAGPRGLECVEHVVVEARRWVRDDGVVLVEVAADQARSVQELALAAGYASAQVHDDLTGRPRFVEARRG